MKKPLSLGFSPCPNDTFILDALAHQKVDLEGLDFEVHMADVEELNSRAFRKELDITKLSFHVFSYLTGDYVLLDAGSALGNNCGPLLIAKKDYSLEQIEDFAIAIPGRFTTANFLLSLAAPKATNKTEILFSEIEDRVMNGEFGAGLIIHENRFTYGEKGLKKIIDLGEYWESRTGCPIPLGGIAIKRDLPEETQRKANRVLKRSVEFAFAHPHASIDFVKAHAQAMEEEAMRKHIALYVNDYTRDLGAKGKEAIRTLFRIAQEEGLIPKIEASLFLD